MRVHAMVPRQRAKAVSEFSTLKGEKTDRKISILHDFWGLA
jgi:hypothetical protein